MSLSSDLRISCRALSRSKGFASASALTLGLGIAATTTIFSVVYGVLLRPLPYADASRLVLIQGEKAYSTGPRIMNFSAPELEPFAGAVRGFSAVAMSGTTVLTFRNDGAVESVPAATVSGDFFETLGTSPMLGRLIADEPEPNVVISERLWRRAFGGADVLGSSITLADAAHERVYTIVGVMPAAFQVPYARTDVWRSLAFARVTGDQRVRELIVGGHEIYARMRDGVTLAAASADAASVVDTVLKPHFTTSRIDMYAKVTPLETHLRGTMGPTLWVLMGAVSLVLLVACANVANLILVRQTSRAREISVRLALGAPKRSLLTFLLAESVVIAVAGALAGLAMTFSAVRLLQWLQPAQIPRLDAIAVDLPVLLFAATSAIASVALAALSPAVLATRSDVVLLMRAGSRGVTTGGPVKWLRSSLVIVEIAMSIMLIIGASLLGRSLVTLLDTDLGVNTDNVIAANLDMSPGPGRLIDDARRVEMVRELEQRLAAHPSILSVGLGLGVPPNGEMMRVSFIFSNGKTTDSHMVTSVLATPGYFRTLQIRLLAGRFFDTGDTGASQPVVIINREAARRFFGSDNPLGRTLPLMNSERTIVGVVDNVKYTGIAAGPEGVIYLPYEQSAFRIAMLFARTKGDPNDVAGDVRRIITSYDPGIGVPRIQSLDAFVADATSQPRFRTILLGSIAGMALVLAMVGLYGVMAYSTAQRTTEIGVRMAVGAQKSDVMRLVIGEGIRLSAIGVALGLLAAYWSSTLIGSFLYLVSPDDAAAFGGSAIALMLIALIAAYLPAVRATRIDPVVALRSE